MIRFALIVASTLGFVGAVLIIVLFVLFIVQGLWIAYRAENLYCTCLLYTSPQGLFL